VADFPEGHQDTKAPRFTKIVVKQNWKILEFDRELFIKAKPLIKD